MEHIHVKCRRLDPRADLPQYQTCGASGMDLHAAVPEPALLQPGEFRLIPCGIAVSIPVGYEAQIRPRSGLAAKYGITILNSPGTIDSDYRGEICVILINLGKEAFTINPHDRIAQMIFSPVVSGEFIVTQELDESDRSSGGFGHTGV